MNEAEAMENPGDLRRRVLSTVKRFKGNWIDLGRCLAEVQAEGSFQGWGYDTFADYCTRELKIRKTTADKLLRSYRFLRAEEPEFLSRVQRPEAGPETVPDVESVNLLRRARSNRGIAAEDYSGIRSAVLDEGVQAREAGKLYRDLLAAVREETPSAPDVWEARRSRLLKGSLVSLRRVRANLENGNYVPARVLDRLKETIRELEAEIAGE
ncbi:MAG TPA: hypothetical protein PLI51_11160 [bacterium]|nr:hypothetical protein [bacterium]